MKLVLILLLVSSCNRVKTIDRRTQFHVTWKKYNISCNKIDWKDKGYTLTSCDSGVKEVINATNIIIYE